MSEKLRRCAACSGLGYFRCECWPGDCICGQDEETCWECDGDGVIHPAYDDDFDTSPAAPSTPGATP